MKIAIPAETDKGEPRVAATPDTVKRLTGLGAEVVVEKGAGVRAGILDADYTAAGAKVAGSAADAVKDADVVLKVRRPAKGELSAYKPGALLIGSLDPYGNETALAEIAAAKISAFSMELVPRITRAQSMDVLSSQANLAGYRAVIDGAAEYGKAMPMMMTAAGTVPAAKVFVMGAGVAGLQAIATARRLGAVVTATDVQKSKWSRSARNSLRSWTTSSRLPRPRLVTPRKCRKSIRRNRPRSSLRTYPSKIS
jgi:H+-translocating NAD(P) transhydrogenase subunit alpha